MRSSTGHAGSNRGFTLVETLVVVAVIAVLISISLPAIADAKRASTLAANLAYQPKVGALLMLYANDHDGAFPYWGEPGRDWAPTYTPSGTLYATSHWRQPYTWGYFLSSRGYDGWVGTIYAGLGDWRPSADPEDVWSSTHWLPHCAYADAAYWTPGVPRADSMLRGQRFSDVAHPNAKGLLLLMTVSDRIYPSERWTLPETPWVIWFGDGHSAAPRNGDLLPATNWGLGVNEPGIPVLTTELGLEGRDVR